LPKSKKKDISPPAHTLKEYEKKKLVITFEDLLRRNSFADHAQILQTLERCYQ
jgi:hypothetical protein